MSLLATVLVGIKKRSQLLHQAQFYIVMVTVFEDPGDTFKI